MRDDISSKSLGTSTELLVIADMKPDFVSIRDSITYATRLRILLRSLNAIRKIGLEEKENTVYIGPIDRLQTIHHIRWTVFQENRKMLLAVTFDRPLEPYVRRIVGVAGPVLDAILCHCEAYDGHACYQGHEGFAKWVAERQIDVDLYGNAAPRLTVDDMGYLTELEQMQRSMRNLRVFDQEAARLHIDTQSEKIRQALEQHPDLAREQALDLIRAMYRLREYFPPFDGPVQPGSDAFFLHRLTKSLVFGFSSDSLKPDEEKTFAREIAWFRTFEDQPLTVSSPAGKPTLPVPGAVQGGILNSYGPLTHGALLLLRFGDQAGARAFLREQKGQITTNATVGATVFTNLALTYKGLKRLGLSEPALRKLPKEFRDGMEARAGLLGDLGVNHPGNWTLPRNPRTGNVVRMSSVDVVVQLRTDSEIKHDDLDAPDHPLRAAVAAWSAQAARHNVEVLTVETMRRTKDPKNQDYSVEHFGFRDGISQPYVEGAEPPGGGIDRDRFRLGDVFLGYENIKGDPASDGLREELAPIMADSTYLVLRKLRQDVGGFRSFINSAGSAPAQRLLEAKLMGRHTDGRPLLSPAAGRGIGPGQNDFDYSDDPDGAICPLASHVRRANPRTATEPGDETPLPRIIRRGMSYGSRYSRATANEERGLFFMAYNASIAEQFEAVQRWLTGGNSTGVFSGQDDPVLGIRQTNAKETYRFMHRGAVRRFDLPADPFVTLQWGLYLFVPSMQALAILSGEKGELPQVVDDRIGRGARTLHELTMYEEALKRALPADATPEQRREVQIKVLGAWKALLEDPSGEDLADELWALVRAKGGVLPSPYGVLVGDLKTVREVFQDDGSKFSTREYWQRMGHSIGALYLGLDPCPAHMPDGAASEDPARDRAFEAEVKKGDYQRIAPPTNAWLGAFTEERGFDDAVAKARDWFATWLPKRPDPSVLELKDYVADIVGELSVDWFGLPRDGSIDIGGPRGDKPNTPDDLVSASYYFFGPRPTPFVVKEGRVRGQALRQVILDYVQKKPKVPDTLLDYLQGHAAFKDDDDLIARTLVGCTNGFVAATRGSFLSVMRRWIGDEDLWRLRHALQAGTAAAGGTLNYQVAREALREALVIGMQKRSRPNLLHRVAMQDMRLNGVPVKAGQMVVVSLQSAAEQQPGDPEILFGGTYGSTEHPTVHACSGQSLALGVLLGMIAVVMEQSVLEPDATFSLSLSRD